MIWHRCRICPSAGIPTMSPHVALPPCNRACNTARPALAALRARPDRLDKLPEAAAERDIRYLKARLRSAIVVDAAAHPATEVAFGLCVTVTDDAGHATPYQITGEDEADARLHRIAPHAPLARALLGARVGDSVTLKRPAGDLTLTVDAIALPPPA